MASKMAKKFKKQAKTIEIINQMLAIMEACVEDDLPIGYITPVKFLFAESDHDRFKKILYNVKMEKKVYTFEEWDKIAEIYNAYIDNNNVVLDSLMIID